MPRQLRTGMTADVQVWSQAGLQYEAEEGVAWLRLNRPAKRNAIDRPLRTALLAAIHEVSEDPQVRARLGLGGLRGQGVTPGGPLAGSLIPESIFSQMREYRSRMRVMNGAGAVTRLAQPGLERHS